MSNAPQIVIVSPDPRLRAELLAGLNGIVGLAPIVHSATKFRQGVEEIRSRRPDFTLVEMTNDLRALTAFADEAMKASPETNLAAVFAPDVFGADVSESAVLIEALRAGFQDFLRRPLSRTDLEQMFARLSRRASPVSTRDGAILSFVSNKGGVGKSTISTNVACELARRKPGQVLLIDASLQLGVDAVLLDLKPATTLADAARESSRLDEVLIRQLATPHECGLHLLAAPPGAIEAAAISDAVMARVLTIARRSYDYVLVDTFPMIDSVMMAVLDLSDRVYIVLESLVPTVLGAARLVELFDSLGLPRERQRVLLSRYTGSTGNLAPADVALRLGRPIDHVLPFDKRIAVSANIGRPFVLGARRWWGLGRAFSTLVNDVERVTPSRNLPREESETNDVRHSTEGSNRDSRTS